ncbi:D-alanyl-D-alanine carboxypeptidase family protein [Micromonospora rifamycinica]|uniref:D-alanyl-D-alanine carboxypeptidase family protein n=1 Tax=Micromonospora rifamycinica TaxID=291594 RepID=UPI00076DCDA2|nr:D-alanyl-D-alanine carboxypeptidase [Micromonospora rifamycinica]
MRVRGRTAVAIAALLLSPVGVPTGAVAAVGAVTTGPCAPVPAASRPPRPVPPRADPAARTVGGPALATRAQVRPTGTRVPPAVQATSWLVADLDSGDVLGGCGPHEYGTPASVQKLLLAATVLPTLDPRQVVTLTAGDLDIEPGSSAVGFAEGGRYRIETLWLGLLLKSGNEAANALARLGGGPDGLPGGLQAMNAHARHLGALQTHAVTPSGLDGPGQFTSAYDLALIARACFADATFRRYDTTREVTIPAQPALGEKAFPIENDNQLLYRYPGALGGKTGYTDLARHTYVGAAERGGRRLVVTLLGAEVVDKRGWEQGAALLDWGFGVPRGAAVGRLVNPGELTAGPSATAVPPPPLAAAGGPGRLDPPGHPWSRPLVAVSLAAVVAGLAGLLFALRHRPHDGRRRR